MTPIWTKVKGYIQVSMLFLHFSVLILTIMRFTGTGYLIAFVPIPITSASGWLYALILTALFPLYMTFISTFLIPIITILSAYYIYVTLKHLWFNPIMNPELSQKKRPDVIYVGGKTK